MGCDINALAGCSVIQLFQFTHPVWGATDPQEPEEVTTTVSIHAPRVGCDCSAMYSSSRVPRFQFTHPVWGATSCFFIFDCFGLQFQFTHPVWGATRLSRWWCTLVWSFNSRTPCGVRPITSLFHDYREMFQFTHPVWGATNTICSKCGKEYVSIHAPRVGCDSSIAFSSSAPFSFNSRTPCGVRHRCLAGASAPARFNSRTPCGVRQNLQRTCRLFDWFQFTHPVWGAT